MIDEQESGGNMSDRVGPYMAVSYPDLNRFTGKNSQHGTVVGLPPTVLSHLWDGHTRTQHGWQPQMLLATSKALS